MSQTYTKAQYDNIKKQRAYAWRMVYALHEQTIDEAPALIDFVSNAVGKDDKNKLIKPQEFPAHITIQLWDMANRLNETYSCPICFDLTTKDTFHLTSCGHILCKDCLKNLQEISISAKP